MSRFFKKKKSEVKLNNLRNDFNVKPNDRTSEWIKKKIEINIFEDKNKIINFALLKMIEKKRKQKVYSLKDSNQKEKNKEICCC